MAECPLLFVIITELIQITLVVNIILSRPE